MSQAVLVTPQSNGLAELGMKTIKKHLKKTKDPYKALLAYRSAPLKNGYSPAELCMGQKLQTMFLVPLLH